MHLHVGFCYGRGFGLAIGESSAQTPYEYLPALGRAFPDCRTEAAAITEAYVKVHYGEAPESLKDLQAIRECWQRIRERETATVKREP